MFRKILKYYGDRRLLRAYKSRQRNTRIKTLKNSKSVGILWNSADEGSFETYESLRKTLQSRGIKQIGLAYISSKREWETLSTVTHSGFLQNKDVRWFGRPKTGSGMEFVQEPFDILIDLSTSKTIALEYIVVHSPATFRVGWQGSEPNFYDLNIDVTEKPQCKYLMEQILFYLENINEKD